MKKRLFISLTLTLTLVFTACDRKTSCTCKDANGQVVKYSELTSNKKDRDFFENECAQTKVQSVKDSTTVYTPCEITG